MNNVVYKNLLYKFKLPDSSKVIKMVNKRTNTVVTSLKSPQLLVFDASGPLVVFENRRYWPQVAAAECAWQFTGAKDAKFINKWAPKVWSKFMNKSGHVDSAYGYRMINTFGFNQIEMAIAMLKADDTSRQVWVQVWEPLNDMNLNKKPNVPCVLGFKLSIHNYKLNIHVVMRSSDVVVGLPYDVMCYHMTLKAIAAAIRGVEPAVLSFTLLDAHYYEPQQEIIDHDEWIKNPITELILPNLTPKMIAADPDFYVESFITTSNHHPYQPKVEVIV